MRARSDEATLYGITPENSSRHGDDLWGKNQFNSAFPLSLCLYMRDRGVKPVAVISRSCKIKSVSSVWPMDRVVGAQSSNIHYHFEKEFSGFSRFFRKEGEADKIDLVVAQGGRDLIPLEVKLTVVPDSGTASEESKFWGPEIVLRPVGSAYAMMRLADSLGRAANEATRRRVVASLKEGYNAVTDWDNIIEIRANAEKLRNALHLALEAAESVQRPFLVQPIWRTTGQSLVFCERCFDVFVWSDVAVMRIPLEMSHEGTKKQKKKSVSRPLREVARHVRALYDILNSGDYDYSDIYKGMALGRQTDKAFAVPGRVARGYLRHSRLANPTYPPDTLQDLILNEGEFRLKPERRFDAAVLGQMTTGRARHG